MPGTSVVASKFHQEREIVGNAKFSKRAIGRANFELHLAGLAGNPRFCDLARMPHLLVAGATGQAVGWIECQLMSLLYRATPDQVEIDSYRSQSD